MSASVASCGFITAWASVCRPAQNASRSPVSSPPHAPATIATTATTATRPAAASRDRWAATTSESRRRPVASAVTARRPWPAPPTTWRPWSIRDGPAQREGVEPELPAVLDERRVVGQLVVRDAGVPLLHRDQQLPTGEVGAGATV